jgi:hypothetical protein
MPRLSEQLSRTVLLKREDLQPIFSFKLPRRTQQNRQAARYPAKVGSSAAPQPRHHNPRRQLPLEGKASQRALAEAHRAKQAARSLRRNGGRAASGLLHFRKTKGGHFRMPLRGQIRTSQSQGDSCHAGEGETALSLGLVDFVVSDSAVHSEAMSIQLKAKTGAICRLSLSFNNDGPLGTFFRYIGDTGTYIARYDDLVNGKEEKIDVSKVDVSMNGIELQTAIFFAAIQEEREPNASAAQVLPCYQVLHSLDQQLALEVRPRSWLRG